jgi:hypothetical protein
VDVLAVRDGADGWSVVTVPSPDDAYQDKPRLRCPWLRDSTVGAFPHEVFRHSARTIYNLATRELGCHADEPEGNFHRNTDSLIYSTAHREARDRYSLSRSGTFHCTSKKCKSRGHCRTGNYREANS